jgi:hypothetical protein
MQLYWVSASHTGRLCQAHLPRPVRNVRPARLCKLDGGALGGVCLRCARSRYAHVIKHDSESAVQAHSRVACSGVT